MVATQFDKRPLLRRFAWEWLALALLLAAFGGLLTWVWQADRHALEKRETERLHAQATVIERNAVRQLEGVNQALEGFMARLPGWQQRPGGMSEASGYLDALNNAMPDVNTLFYLDENGIGRAFSSDAAEFVGRDYSQRPYFVPVRQNPKQDQLYISEPFTTLQGDYLINIMRVIAGPNGEFKGVVAAGLKPAHYRVLLNSVLYAPDMWVSIAHGGGVQFMMEPDRAGQSGLQLNRPGSLFAKHMQSGQVETLHQAVSLGTGQRRFMVIRTIDVPDLNLSVPFVLGIGRGLDEVYQPSDALRINYTLIYAAVLISAASGLLINQKLRLHARQASWEARREIREREEVLSRFFSVNLDLFAVLDRQGRFKRVNEAWQRMLGYSELQVTGMDVSELIHPDDLHKIEAKREKLLAGIPTVGFIMRMRHASGHYLEVEWRALFSQDQFFLSGRDVTADQAARREIEQLNVRLEAQKARLHDMAFHDGLTGVFNRRRFDDGLATEWRACMREGQSLAILLLDIDHFKRYNDTYGHLQGDECLKQVASVFQAQCRRPRDIVARYGGEEFVAVLPDTDMDGALQKAREIVEAVAALQMPHAASPVARVVTVSVGVAALAPHPEADSETLLRHADDALYSAKMMGRNRAVQYVERASSSASGMGLPNR